ncbi:MAG: TatD DNase family protein [Acidimicrobiales bacterium]|jgi:TatD DNase family protein
MTNFKYIDTHAHLNLSAFDEDRQEVVLRCLAEDVAVINIGTKLSTSQNAVEIAEANDDMYAMVGLHPIQTTPERHSEEEIGGKAFTSKGEEFDTDTYRALAKSSKVVGIGECGFDYFHNGVDTYEVQETAFLQQIELANELQLPLMIHTRDPKPGADSPTGRSVYDDVYDILKEHSKVPANIHFYAGDWEQAQKFFDIGCNISFTGVITFAKDYEEVVRNAPLELIHAETDCPYVAPVPHRGKRCEPTMVKEVYKKIAEIKGLDEEEVRVQLVENARRLYRM